MKYFYDTEFLEDGKTIELISIGIVAEDGREFYAINQDAPWERIQKHSWLMDNVIPTIPRSPSSVNACQIDFGHPDVLRRSTIADRVRNFLLHSGDSELWAYYGAYDHVALCQLFGEMVDLPEGIPMYSHELMQLWGLAGRPEKPGDPEGVHNALSDARWNFDLFTTCVNSLNKRIPPSQM